MSGEIRNTAREMRSLSHKLSVEVSRAAEFAHAFSRTLEGTAFLESSTDEGGAARELQPE